MFKILATLCVLVSSTYAMDCSFGQSGNAVEKFIHQCPSLVSRDDESYCCPKENNIYICCTLNDFIIQWFLFLWPYIVLVLLICMILSCVCCCLRSKRAPDAPPLLKAALLFAFMSVFLT